MEFQKDVFSNALQAGVYTNGRKRHNTGRLLMKIIPADATIAELEKKACEYEEKAKGESPRLLPRSEKKQTCAVSG